MAQPLPACGAYFTGPATTPLCSSAHGQSPSHMYHPCTGVFTYTSLATTLTFSHNVVVIISMPLYPHPCINTFIEFDAYTQTLTETHPVTQHSLLHNATLSYFVLRKYSHKSPQSLSYVLLQPQLHTTSPFHAFLESHRIQSYFHVVLRSLEDIQLPRESYSDGKNVT